MKHTIIKILTFLLFLITIIAIILLDLVYAFNGFGMYFWIGVSIIIFLTFILSLIFRLDYIKESKGLIISFLVFILSLFIFYFTYYTNSYEFEKIPDSYFDDTELYKNVKNPKNGYNIFKDIEFKSFYDIIPDNEYNSLDLRNEDDYKNAKEIKFNENTIKEIDKNIEKILKLNNSDFYIDPYYKIDKMMYQMNSKFNGYYKYSLYNILYYLNNQNEEKSINILINNYIYNNKMLYGYTNLLNKIVNITISYKINNQLNYILDNYSLKENSLKKLKKIYIESLKKDKSIKNTTVHQYYDIINELKTFDINEQFSNGSQGSNKINVAIQKGLFKNFKPLELNSLIFFKKGYVKELLKNIHFYIGKEEIDKEKFCKGKHPDLEEVSKQLFLKQNGISDFYGFKQCLSYISFNYYKQDFENIQIEEEKILEKINKQLETYGVKIETKVKTSNNKDTKNKLKNYFNKK